MSPERPLPAGLRPGGRFEAWAPGPPAYAVCDVDGTLVGPARHATDEVVAAVARAQDAGLRVGIASGRMGGAVAGLRAQLGTLGPDVVCNGGEVRDGGRSLHAWSLTPAQVDGLLAFVRTRTDAYLEVYTPDGYVVSSLDERARPHWDLLGQAPRAVVTGADGIGPGPLLKATFTAFETAAVANLVAAARALGLAADGGAGSPLTPELCYVNVTHPAASKGTALRHAAGHLGVDLRCVVAIGDASNDLSMLEVAGTAIAMGQAPPDIRAAAHLVAPTVDDHGVAAALEACAGWLDAATPPAAVS